MVTPAGFEPAISGVKGQRPGPLDDGAMKIIIELSIFRDTHSCKI